MNKIETGGAVDFAPDSYAESGMTLRDYFAVKAMQGICASGSGGLSIFTQKALAEEAYGLADAMLEARK